jgi:hypothetical protein
VDEKPEYQQILNSKEFIPGSKDLSPAIAKLVSFYNFSYTFY